MINTWPGWESVKLLGEGSFGRVYEICREEFGYPQRAALKVITIPTSPVEIESAKQSGMDEESVTEYFHSFVEEMVAEFALMHQLKSNNTNIVSYEDHMVVQHDDGIGWDILIRMELLVPLQEYLAEHPLSERDVIRLGKDMCSALMICREKGVLHRDIKPENIFYAEDTGFFKLGDFGVARVAEKSVSSFSQKGTYHYMAPEVYSRKPYGFAADIYSLGIVLYRYLNYGRLPFLPEYPEKISYSDNEKALEMRMNGEAVPEPRLGSRKLKDAVLKACAFDPDERYQSPAEFLRALAEAEAEYAAEDTDAQDQSELNRTVSLYGKGRAGKNSDGAGEADSGNAAASYGNANGAENGNAARKVTNPYGVQAEQDSGSEDGSGADASERDVFDELNPQNKKPCRKDKKKLLIIAVVLVLLAVAVAIIAAGMGKGRKTGGSSGQTAEADTFDREYYYALLKDTYGIEAEGDEGEALREGLVDTLLCLNQDDEEWCLSADVSGNSAEKRIPETDKSMKDFIYTENAEDSEAAKEEISEEKRLENAQENSLIFSKVLYEIWLNIYNKDSQQMLEDILAVLERLEGNPNFSDFRDALEAVIAERENSEAEEELGTYFDNAGIASKGFEGFEKMEYALIVSALSEMGMRETRWTLSDADGDGTEELFFQSLLPDEEYRVLMAADADTGAFWAYSETGASWYTGFFYDEEEGRLVRSDGANTAGHRYDVDYRWNGSGWKEVARLEAEAVEKDGEWVYEGKADWKGREVSLDEYDKLSSSLIQAEHKSPKLTPVTVKGDREALRKSVESYLKQKKTLEDQFEDDLDGDGTKEQIFFLSGAANPWFRNMTLENTWGTEPFMGYEDNMVTSIVLKDVDGGAELTVERLPQSQKIDDSDSYEYMINLTFGELRNRLEDCQFMDSFDQPGEWVATGCIGEANFTFTFSGESGDEKEVPTMMNVWDMTADGQGYLPLLGTATSGVGLDQAKVMIGERGTEWGKLSGNNAYGEVLFQYANADGKYDAVLYLNSGAADALVTGMEIRKK